MIQRLTLCCILLAVFTSAATAQSWSVKPTPTTQPLVGVWSLDATNAWAVGGSGTILKWNGTAWSAQASGTTDFINGIWGSSAASIWAVTTGGAILHYNGSSWSVYTSPTTHSLNGIWGYDADHIVAVGDSGTIVRWDGIAWTTQNSGTSVNLACVAGVTPSLVWAAGGSGTTLKWNGTTWSAVTSGTTNFINNVYAADSSTVFVTAGTEVRRFDGGSWTVQSTGLTAPQGIWGTSSNQVWVSSWGGKIAYWNGTTWSLQTTGTTKDFVYVSGTGLMNHWAVGPQGATLMFTPAASSLFAYTFQFTPPGSAKLQYSVGTTARGIIEDADFTGSKVVKLPATFVGFKLMANPGFTLKTIASPQLGGIIHNVATGVPSLDMITPYTPSFGFNVNNARTLQFVYTGAALEPAGSFVMTSPPEGKATPVSSATGNFSGHMGTQPFDFDLATDETGKFAGVGTVAGFNSVTPGTPPTTTPDINLTGQMNTTSGKATGALTLAFSGKMGGRDVKASSNATIPFEPKADLAVKFSGSGSSGKLTSSIANGAVAIPGPTGGGQRAWGYSLNIVEKTDAKGVKYKAATCTLTLPTGDKILFPEKPATYAAKTGYTISCNLGVKLDPTGKPILVYDSKDKLITIAKTTLVFTGLKFSLSGSNWVPTAGTVKYTFLGQTGTGNVLDFGNP